MSNTILSAAVYIASVVQALHGLPGSLVPERPRGDMYMYSVCTIVKLMTLILPIHYKLIQAFYFLLYHIHVLVFVVPQTDTITFIILTTGADPAMVPQ